ncbi:MAG: hypothetical protein V3T24_10340 [Longimicrobiales bacterium]
MEASDSDSDSTGPNEFPKALLEQREWLLRLAERLTGDHQIARCLVQQTFLAAIKNPPPDATWPRGWLSVVAHRIHHKQQYRLSVGSIEELVIAPGYRWQIYQDDVGKWRWRRRGADSEATDRSQREFESRAECEKDARFHGWNGWDG